MKTIRIVLGVRLLVAVVTVIAIGELTGNLFGALGDDKSKS
jgi:hypothetical protein